MSMRPQTPKQALRSQIREQLRTMSDARRAAASAQARALLAAQTRWQNATSVLFYAPMPMELDIWPLLDEALAVGKTAALPRFEAATNTYVA